MNTSDSVDKRPVSPQALQKRVAAAVQAKMAKAEELAAAKETVSRLEDEHRAAAAAVREAQEAADALLPQCRMVRKSRRGGQELDIGRVVILRKTPSGMVIVRFVGDSSGDTYKFKWREVSAVFVQAEKQPAYAGDHRELRDLPAEYAPTA